MANRRTELSARFKAVLGSNNVYFQAPESSGMDYPAIKYNLAEIEQDFANNSPYINTRGYEVTLIDWNPDSPYVDELLKFPCCSFDRHYVAEGLHHWTFTIFN